MKPQTMILMLVAVTCGLGASYMTSRLLAQRGASEGEEKITVLVAVKNLDQGMTIRNPDDLFERKEFLPGSVRKDVITDPEKLKGKMLKHPLRANDQITTEHLVGDNETGLAFMMPAGHRAVGVRVNMSNTAGGFATLPLSRVDLISTVRRGSDDQSFSQILLEKVLVLAVDTTTARDSEGRAMPGNVVTLALKPEDVLKVEMAKELGPLSLALRKVGDDALSEAGKVTVKNIVTNSYQTRAEDVAEEHSGGPKAAKSDLPSLPKDLKGASIVETPQKTFVMRILQGENEKVIEFPVDEKGEVIPREVIRSGVETAPPRPTPSATVPPRPEGPAPPRPPEK